jgi:4-amino-4-deoxy-L-arabinose transferase-like glycosyltransferase
MKLSRKAVCIRLAAFVVLLYMLVTALFWQSFVRQGVPVESFVRRGDAFEYTGIARVMIEDHRFALAPTSSPEYLRMPGHPTFLAGVMVAFGTPLAIPLVQIVLVAISACLIYLMGERIFSRMVGIAAALLYALEPTVVFYAQQAFSETFFVFLLLVIVYMLTCVESFAKRHALLVGVLIGVLTLVRPVGLYIVPIFLIWLWWKYRTDLKQAAVVMVCCVVGVGIVVVPWMARNDRLAGHFSLSSLGAYNALLYNTTVFEMYRTGESQDQVRAHMYERLGIVDGGELRTFEHSDAAMGLVKESIGGHLPSYIFFHFVKTVPFFFQSSILAAQGEYRGFLTEHGVAVAPAAPDVNVSGLLLSGQVGKAIKALVADPMPLIEMMLWLLVFVIACVSVVVLLVKKSEAFPAALFFLALVGALALLTGPVSMPRYRMPAEPFLFLLAAAGAHAVIRWMQRRYAK